MRRLLWIAVLALGFAGCAPHAAPKVDATHKAFEEEDAYTLFALDAQAHGRYGEAAELFAILYERAPRSAYRSAFFQNLLLAKRYGDVLTNVDIAEASEGKTAELERYRVQALVGLQQLEAALSVALALVGEYKAKTDYVAVADIETMLRHYDSALKYLESAYAVDYDEAVLDKLAVTLYVNLERKKEAIARLETHIRLNGCSERICKRLAGFYSDQNNIDGMLETYLRLYAAYPDPQVAEAIVRIYGFKKDLLHLQQFLETYGSDDALLLNLYINAKAYEKASALAARLYEEEGDPDYLAKSAIFAFEAAEQKRDPALLERVTSQLKQAVKSTKDPLQLNYLGYLLIDYDIDPAEGIRYVKMALEQEPDSPFYLDSLAWGYYKNGECQKAAETIRRAVKAMQGETDPELESHVDAIEKCLKNKPTYKGRR